MDNVNTQMSENAAAALLCVARARIANEAAQQPIRATEEGPAQVSNELYTDLGNATRFVRQHGWGIRYCPAWGKWLLWDDTRWKIDETGQIEVLAKQTVRALLREAHNLKTPDTEALKHAVGCQGAYKIRAFISLAQTEPKIPVTPTDLDCDPYLLNCLNGTLELRTGSLRKHRRTDLLTKLAPIHYERAAPCPRFDRFVARIMGGDTEMVAYLQRCIGYALTGDVSEKALFILVGGGDNGKTTLVEALRHVLGDYAGQILIESLMTRRSEGIPNDIARLKGLRFVTSSEVEQGHKLAEAKVKQITGMGTLQARFLFKEYFEFAPTFKIFMDTNHKPEVRGNDPAIWNRLKVIPFNVSIPPGEKDPQLLEKLKEEAPGILAWAVQGCLDWQQHGLGEPDAVKAATRAHREEMDSVADFVEESCERSEGLAETSEALYAAYRDWCARYDEEPVRQRAVGVRLGQLGCTQAKLGGKRGWKGIRLRPAEAGALIPAKAA
jgi:putative DNA primase/helicase